MFAWLFHLARNVAIDHLRANRAIPCEEVLRPETQSEHDIDAFLTVRAALASLPEDYSIGEHAQWINDSEAGYGPRSTPDR